VGCLRACARRGGWQTTSACSMLTVGGRQLDARAPLREVRPESHSGCSGGLHGGRRGEVKRRVRWLDATNIGGLGASEKEKEVSLGLAPRR
jgi:hypothetical protein